MASSKPTSLEEVQEQFRTWRNTRQHKTNIPDELWSAALTLTDRYSLSKISNTLQVNYTALKDKMKSSGIHAHPSQVPQPIFLELPAMQSPAALENSIEMENGRGEKIRIRFSRKTDLDLSMLVKDFWVKPS